MAMILNQLLTKKQPGDALILFPEVVFFRSNGWCWHGRSPTHCGEPFGSAAARLRWTLPLMPLPADLECVAPLLLKIAQSQNRPDARAAWGRRRHRGERVEGVASSPTARSDGVKNAQCHRVSFVMCLFSEGRRQGKRGSWWNDYIVAARGGGACVEQLAETIIV